MKRALFFESTIRDRDGDVCQVAEAFYVAGCRVLIFVESTMEATHFDDLLWTFSKESFVPHRIVSSGREIEGFVERVFIGVEEELFPKVNAVVCVGKTDLEGLIKADTVALPVIMDDDRKKQESRVLWKSLQKLGGSLYHLRASEKREWISRICEIMGS